ncbi:hypothetical protein SERLA73DRAFT_174759, partial [Serpula lacrymans var. lacrymans S7.3]
MFPNRSCHAIDGQAYDGYTIGANSTLVSKIEVVLPPYTRAYLHHLLHTHEMSAHTLLAAHNLTVLDAFFRGVRKVIGKDSGGDITGSVSADTGAVFAQEVERFEKTYDESTSLLDEAREDWRDVDLARGRGRLAREREKE